MDDQRAWSREVEFGSDWPVRCGSEGIRFESANRQQVYGWVERLLVRQECSRQGKAARGLVETKNGAVIRKTTGYGYIHAGHADRINDFYREFLNPYLNYHRPCAQAYAEIDEKGRKRIRYKRYQTPLESLLGLDKPAQYLRPKLSINALRRIAGARSDTDAARRMQQAQSKLFEKLRHTA